MERKLSKIVWLILICCIVLVGSLAYAKTVALNRKRTRWL